jgi:hypothetical protein
LRTKPYVPHRELQKCPGNTNETNATKPKQNSPLSAEPGGRPPPRPPPPPPPRWTGPPRPSPGCPPPGARRSRTNKGGRLGGAGGRRGRRRSGLGFRGFAIEGGASGAARP